jgi:hypothetical protein
LSEKLKSTIGPAWKLVLIALLLCGSMANLGEAADTIFACDTDEMTTSEMPGFGSDCVAAQSDLESATRAEAQAACHSSGYDRMCFNDSVTVTRSSGIARINADILKRLETSRDIAGQLVERCTEKVPWFSWAPADG